MQHFLKNFENSYFSKTPYYKRRRNIAFKLKKKTFVMQLYISDVFQETIPQPTH